MLKASIEAIQKWVTPGTFTDPDVVLYAARIAVWGRWFIWLVGVFMRAYRPASGTPRTPARSATRGRGAYALIDEEFEAATEGEEVERKERLKARGRSAGSRRPGRANCSASSDVTCPRFAP